MDKWKEGLYMSYTVLMYHEIRNENEQVGDNPIDVNNQYEDILPTPLYSALKGFEVQMDYLHNEGYYFLRLNEIKEYHEGRLQLPEKSVLVSFDDAYQSVLEYAYPILKKYNIKASMFVVSGWLQDVAASYDDKKSITLTYEQLL